jgi:anti-sigma factor RsiW
MRCKNVERLIIEATDRKLNDREKTAIEEHTEKCAVCASFQTSFGDIRSAVKNIPVPQLDPDLEEKTWAMCHREICSLRAFDRSKYSRIRRSNIPALVWGALVSLTILTAVIVVPQVKDYSFDQSMTFANIVGLSMILQNAVMLILTPLIMRKYHPRGEGLNPIKGIS